MSAKRMRAPQHVTALQEDSKDNAEDAMTQLRGGSRRLRNPGRLASTPAGRLRPLASRSEQAPAPRCENVYVPGPTGNVLIAPHFDTRVRLPFYGLVLLAMGEQPIEVKQAGYTARHRAMAVWAPDASISAPSGYVCISINPLHRAFRRFSSMPQPHVVPLEVERFGRFAELVQQAEQGTLSHAGAMMLFNGFVDECTCSLPDSSPSRYRAQLLRRILWEQPHCSLDELAGRLGLSYHRTSHLFSEAVGLPVRSYQLWEKLFRSWAPLAAGYTLTDVAHEAGFTDLAHYSRVYKEAFGRSPYKMLRTRRTRLFSPETFKDPLNNTLCQRPSATVSTSNRELARHAHTAASV
jgi:AraC-like DNA-binding protein